MWWVIYRALWSKRAKGSVFNQWDASFYLDTLSQLAEISFRKFLENCLNIPKKAFKFLEKSFKFLEISRAKNCVALPYVLQWLQWRLSMEQVKYVDAAYNTCKLW